MHFLTGPSGSGKTRRVFESFVAAVRAGDTGVRLLAPTATLAQHLQNEAARAGLVLRPRFVETLYHFIDHWAEDLPETPKSVLYLSVEEAARRLALPEFAAVIDLPGFCAALARAIEELSAAGCDAARLAAHLPDAPLARPLLAVYEEVQRRGVVLRARRLALAAGRIERDGAAGLRAVWLDGFHALPEPELGVLHALSRHTQVTVTLPEAEAARLAAEAAAVERLPPRSAPAVQLFEARNIEREADEIARRILEQASAGRPFGEIGVIVRQPASYQALLRATFERYGIPARFYFDLELERHPITRHLTGLVDALLGGWDHAQTLAALRLAPGYATSGRMDRFEFALRERLPGRGLDAFADALGRRVDALRGLEAWLTLSLSPSEWAGRLCSLAGEVWIPPPVIERSQAEALKSFAEAMQEASQALAPHPLPLAAFWRAAKAVVRLKTFQPADQRRNAVRVLSAHEARQWRLGVGFVCGLVEKEFPQAHRPDPFLPESARRQLNGAGIRIRAAADFETEERALFDSAVSRASLLAVLSYPRLGARGQPALRSIYLDDFPLPVESPPAVRPARAVVPEIVPVTAVREGTVTIISPTALEDYLHCPYKHFARRVLLLKPPPAEPEERLDYAKQGEMVHDVLAEWRRRPADIESIFQRVFDATCERLRVPGGYAVEALRHRMLGDLLAFTARQAPNGRESRLEEKFEFELEPGLRIAGRLDRLDMEDGRGYLIDYKYSGSVKGRLEDPNNVQAQMYALAAERCFQVRPLSVQYCALKGKVEWVGAEAPFPQNWLQDAVDRSLAAVAAIRAGRIAPAPVEGACAHCDYLDVCRYRAAAGEAAGA